MSNFVGIVWERCVVNGKWLLAVILSGAVSVPVAADYSQHPEALRFIDTMSSEQGFAKEELLALFAQAEKKQAILDAIARPAEKTKTWGEYRNIFIQAERIEKGAQFWLDNTAALERADAVYGVPPQMVTAIIGVETRYGKNTGSYRVLDALATLGFDYPPRAAFFSKELQNFLLLAREQERDPLSLTGSYAGAMGYGQFMPSSYRAYAVDFDNDDFKDIWHNTTDAIGSVANYFHRHGWVAGEPVVVRAKVSHNYDKNRLTEGLSLQHTVAELSVAGFTPLQPLHPEANAMAMKLQGEHGAEFWLGVKNFEVITRYNRSQLYALAVYQLSEEIAKQHAALQQAAAQIESSE